MNRVYSLALILILAVVVNVPAWAQAEDEEDGGHLFVVQTFDAVIPEGGRAAERDSLLELWYEHVVTPNEFIVSERNLRHLYGSDSGDWIVITEYRTWNDIDEAGRRSDELFRLRWATPEARRAFNRALGKYFGGHTDEIYTDLPDLGK